MVLGVDGRGEGGGVAHALIERAPRRVAEQCDRSRQAGPGKAAAAQGRGARSFLARFGRSELPNGASAFIHVAPAALFDTS